MHDGLVEYREFRQRVRRHPPSSLLPLLAVTAIENLDRDVWMTGNGKLLTPWALAAASMESIVSGNEHRRQLATRADVLSICELHSRIRDPDLVQEEEDGLTRFMLRISNQQFGVDGNPLVEAGRSHAMLQMPFEEPGDCGKRLGLEVIHPENWEPLLGATLERFLSVGFLLHVGALKNKGVYDPAWFDLPHFTPLVAELPGDIIRGVVNRAFSITVAQVRAQVECARAGRQSLEAWAFNPLVARPVVDLPWGRLIPQPRFVVDRISAPGLLFTGMDTHGESFARDYGRLAEHYAGKQLELLPGGQVHPEIQYERGQKSVDFIVVFERMVVLVEVKASRLRLRARMGDGDIDAALHPLRKAFVQLGRTDALLAAGHPGLAHVPADLPRLGLVVTLDPWFLANSKLVRQRLPTPSLPVEVIALDDVERLATYGMMGAPQDVLLGLLERGRSSDHLAEAFRRVKPATNPILKASWERLPLLRLHRDSAARSSRATNSIN